MKKFITIIFLISIFSCATTANYDKILQTWIGESSDQLVASWGPPQSSYQLSDGSRVLEYVRARTMTMGGDTHFQPQVAFRGAPTTYVLDQTPIYNVNKQCRTIFTVNSSGIITRWRWQGNDCKTFHRK